MSDLDKKLKAEISRNLVTWCYTFAKVLLGIAIGLAISAAWR